MVGTIWAPASASNLQPFSGFCGVKGFSVTIIFMGFF